MSRPNKITGANAGGPRQWAIRTRPTARIAQFNRWTARTPLVNTSFVILACSGPGAAATIQQSITIGYFCAAFGGVITLALAFDAWRVRDWRFTLPIAAVMLLVHPAWTVSAVHGDCGFFKRDVSYFFTAIYVALMIYQYVISRRAA